MAGIVGSHGASNSTYLTAESRARMEIDRQLHACGWVVQDRSAMNLYASQGVAVREFIVVVDPEEGCQLMVEVGDRIRLSSMKGPGREGVVTAVTGALVRVRWTSGDETTVAPAPGTLSVLAAGKAVPQKGAKKSAAKNTAGAAKKKVASKSAPPKKSGARKTKGSQRPLR